MRLRLPSPSDTALLGTPPPAELLVAVAAALGVLAFAGGWLAGGRGEVREVVRTRDKSPISMKSTLEQVASHFHEPDGEAIQLSPGVTCLDFKRKIGPSRWWSASYCLLELDAITGNSGGGAGGAFGPPMTR